MGTAETVQALRRIDKLEAVRRRVERSLRRCVPGSPLHGELSRQRDELDEQIVHCRDVVAAAEAAGFKVWSREDFTRGDLIRYRGAWFEVLRVNARSVTVRHAEGEAEWTLTVGYHDGITDRAGPGETASRENGQRPKDHGA